MFICKVAVSGDMLFGFKVVSMVYSSLGVLQPIINNEREIRVKIYFLNKDILVHIIKFCLIIYILFFDNNIHLINFKILLLL